jgi:hypothetical protein
MKRTFKLTKDKKLPTINKASCGAAQHEAPLHDIPSRTASPF